jgi:hypothetical protein
VNAERDDVTGSKGDSREAPRPGDRDGSGRPPAEPSGENVPVIAVKVLDPAATGQAPPRHVR